MPATRFVLGPAFDFARKGTPTTPPALPPSGKPDVTVSFLGLGVDGSGKDTARVQLPAYDLATANRLCEVRAYLVPAGTPAPADAAAFVASAFPFTLADVSTHQGGGELPLTLADVPAGPNGADAAYLGQIVLGMEA